MITRILRLAPSLALALALAAGPALAQTDHLAMAISETQKAIHYGAEVAHGSSFVQHTDNAIDHAMMAQKAKPNKHIKAAIADLRRGKRIVDGTHWASILRRGAKQAQKALTQLQAAQ
jgi:Small metal-binding protein